MKRSFSIIGGLLMLLIFSCNSKTPIPQEKKSYIGTWRSDSGIVIIINEDGTGSLKQNISHDTKDFKSLGIAVAPAFINDLLVKFEGEKKMSLSRQFYYAKEYIVGVTPYSENGQYKMILNEVGLIKDR